MQYTIKKDSIAELQLLLGINREFTEDDWRHIVGHYNASLQTNRSIEIHLPNASVTRRAESSSVESSLTTWHRRGLAVEYCLKHPPDFSLFAK